MIIILRPLGKDPWSGLIKYRNCYEDLGPYFTRSGRIYTGLTKADEERLGGLLSLDLSPTSEFWVSFFIRTGAKDLYLDTTDPMDELRYVFLKSHKRVASSIFERKSSANFVLINKDEEAKKANVYGRLKRKALKEFDRLSREDIVKCLRLYGHNAETVSAEVAENMLFDIIEGNPSKFIEVWVENKDKETQFLLEKAIARNVIRKNKNIYRYGSDTIGHGLDDTISFLKDVKNQDIRIGIERAVESKSFMPEIDKEVINEVKKIDTEDDD